MRRPLLSSAGLVLLSLVLAFAAVLPIAFGAKGHTLLGASSLALFAALFFLVVPFLLIRFVFKEKASEYGWRLPENPKEALRLTALVLIPHLVAAAFFSQLPEFEAHYSLAGRSLAAIALFVVPISALYYLAEEFLFRGFLFFALLKRLGWGAFVVNALIFALLHFGKPSLEMLFSASSAILLCWLSYKTKSFLPAAFVHWFLSLFLNLLIFTLPAAPLIHDYHF